MEETKRNALQRFYESGDLHFVTFSCYRRRPFLGTVRARNCFVKILDEVRSRHGFALLGYVLMPEHVHLLMGEPEHGDPSKVLQVVKQKVSPGALGSIFSLGLLTFIVLPFDAQHPTVIPSEASRRIFFLLRSREGVGLRSRGISPPLFPLAANAYTLYAPESRGPKIGTASARLAMEQLELLCQR